MSFWLPDDHLVVQSDINKRLQNGLAGHWTFDRNTISGTNVRDISRNGNTGTLVNGPTATMGRIRQALSFNGTNQYVVVPSSSSLDMSGGQMTISMWVKLASSQANWAGVIAKGTTNNDWALQRNSGLNILRFFTSSAYVDFKSGSWSAITDNMWHFLTVALSHSDSQQYMYLDSVLYDTKVNTNLPTQTSSYTLHIGSSRDPVPIKGFLDDVRIYNRVLDIAEIKALYYQSFNLYGRM